MKYINIMIKKYGEKGTGLVLLFSGIIIGILISKSLKGFYWNELDLLNDNYFDLIKNMEIDKKILRNYVLIKDLKNFILIWGLCFTKIGIVCLVFIILYYGMVVGFFISVLLMGYGLKGLLLLFGYTFPQLIIYVPVFVLSIQGGYWLCRNLYYNGLYHKNRGEVVGKYIIFMLILGVFLVIGALLETYVGSFILIKILGAF